MSDLFLDLGVSVAIAIISVIAVLAIATGIAGSATLAGAGLLMTVLIAGATFAVSLVLGALWSGAEWMMGFTGIDKTVKVAVRKFIASSNQFFIDSWHDQVAAFADELDRSINHNLPKQYQMQDLIERSFGGEGLGDEFQY